VPEPSLESGKLGGLLVALRQVVMDGLLPTVTLTPDFPRTSTVGRVLSLSVEKLPKATQ
jgi:hypothetical protein